MSTDANLVTDAGGTTSVSEQRAIPGPREYRSNYVAHGSAPSGVTLLRAVRAELTKLRSLRSTWWTLLIALALAIGFAALLAAIVVVPEGQEPGSDPSSAVMADPVAVALAGGAFSSLVLGVQGILVISGEYATGSVCSSVLALPRRWLLVVAKALSLVIVLVPWGLLLSVGALLIAEVLHGRAVAVSWSDRETLTALIGTSAYIVTVALLGLGLGLLLRSAAAAISALVGIVFVAPTVLGFFTADWIAALRAHLPDAAASSLQSTTGTGVLSDVAAWLTLLGWAVAPLALGAIALQRRDA